MDAAHLSAVNGIDIILWLALLYWAPRFLRARPARQARRTRPVAKAPTVMAEQPTLKIA